MTTYSATLDTIKRWADSSASMVETTQIMTELPEDQRSFPLLRASQVAELAGVSEWVWREYVKELPPDQQPLRSPGGHTRATLEHVHRFMESRGERPRRPSHVKRATRVAIENFKGGVSKSATTLHLGVALARKGYRILLIDTDPQATLTQFLGVRPASVGLEDTLAAAIFGTADGEPVGLKPRATYINGLSLIPSSLQLSRLEIEVMRQVNVPGRSALDLERRFDEALAAIDSDYDLVLVDSQPAFSMTQALLLLTMDSLIVPMPTEAADFAGTSDFLHQISGVLKPLDELRDTPKVWDPLLVVHTRLRKGTDLIHDIAANTFGSNRLLEYVDDQPVISAALGQFRSVFEIGPDVYDIRAIKKAQEQYDTLAQRVIEIISAKWNETTEEPVSVN